MHAEAVDFHKYQLNATNRLTQVDGSYVGRFLPRCLSVFPQDI